MEIGDVSVRELVSEYGTPLYVYDSSVIKKRFSELKKAISYPKTKIYYSCKANNNPEILKLLKQLGIDGIDVVSTGEAKLALSVGFKPEQISLTNPSVSEQQMKWLHERGIQFKADSISQLNKWLNLKDEATIRINPGTGLGHHEHVVTGGWHSKFGLYPGDKEELEKVKENVTGLHQHAGSGALDVDEFMEKLQPLYQAAKNFPNLKKINIGGGLGIPYEPGEKPLNIEEFGEKLSESFQEFCDDYGKNLELELEPGRFFVAESGYLLSEVTAIKESPARKFVVVNTGFNHLLRPILYDAHHKAVNATSNGEKEKVWVGGNICESGDLLTDERELSKVREGDIIALYNTGAYGYSMASHYTGADLPAEVMVEEGEHRLIRKSKPFFE